MRIYQIWPDVNHYQFFLTVQPGDYDRFSFDATPTEGKWISPEVRILAPKLKRGDFLQWNPGVLIMSQRATDLLGDYLSIYGEQLPLKYKGETFTVFNVTTCIDCLDHEKSSFDGKWHLYFDPAWLIESPLFKIPETVGTAIYTVEGMESDIEEFRKVYTRCGLKGLEFDLVWTDEKVS